MKRFNIYLKEYDWLVRVYVGKTCLDTPEILDTLRMFGCKGKNLRDAGKELRKCEYNTGMTYSYTGDKITVLVIGVTDSAMQFFNSLTHEIMHLSVHISVFKGIDLESEEPCYIAGEAAMKIYHHVREFLCCHCHGK